MDKSDTVNQTDTKCLSFIFIFSNHFILVRVYSGNIGLKMGVHAGWDASLVQGTMNKDIHILI